MECCCIVFVCMLVLCCCCVVEGGGERVMVSILLGSMSGSASALVCACLLSLIFRYLRRVPILKGPVVFSPRISPKTLHSALHRQLPIPSDGKTLLDNGLTVAVRKLQPSPNITRRRIQLHLQTLSTFTHRHLTTLLAYLAEPDRFYLVYDYLPTATLEDAFRNHFQIAWDARLRIAVGIIKALHYLHTSCTPALLHYDLNPSNVLLDSDFEPTLRDSGLANIFHGLRSPDSYCYYAPECFPDFSIYTDKSDIFSFGVILGMLLTGRDPRDPLFGEAGGMGMWFRQVVEAGDGREALDKTLLGEETQEDEMLMAVRIAAVCLSHMPLDRPSSDELVPMLTQLHSF